MSLKRVYERKFTVEAGTAFVIPSNESPKLFAVDFPPEGLIKKLVVKQVGGTLVAYSVNLYNDLVGPLSAPGDAMPDGGSSEIPENFASELAKVIPTQTATAGQVLSLLSDAGYAFRNTRGTWSVPERKIYLEIDPVNPSNVTTWEVAIAMIPAIPNG